MNIALDNVIRFITKISQKYLLVSENYIVTQFFLGILMIYFIYMIVIYLRRK